MQAHNATGWDATRCPACNCQRLDVTYTYKRNGLRCRVRVCQLCGKRIRTVETFERMLADVQKQQVTAETSTGKHAQLHSDLALLLDTGAQLIQQKESPCLTAPSKRPLKKTQSDQKQSRPRTERSRSTPCKTKSKRTSTSGAKPHLPIHSHV